MGGKGVSAVPPWPSAAAKAATGKTGKSAAKQGVTVPPPSALTVDVYNGDPDANGLATQVSQALVALGYKAGAIENASAQSQTGRVGTQVFYGVGASAGAQQIAIQFGTTPTSLSTLPAGHVEVLIGSAVTAVPAGIAPSTAAAGTASTGAQLIGARAAASTSDTPAPSSTTPAGSGTGSTVVVAPDAKYGIPCVY